LKEICQFDDIPNIDLREGTIVEAHKKLKADRLLTQKEDTGIDVRALVSGIVEHVTPEAVIGKRVTVLTNLAPRKLRGVESEGMLLLTQNKDGKIVFVNPDEENVETGSTIG